MYRVFWLAIVASVLPLAGSPVKAALITHTPGDRVPPVVVSPGSVAAGGVVGTNYIAFGVDYTFGGQEGVFNDLPLAFGGVNGSNVVDLLAPVDGKIVLLNTTTQGLTNFVSVLAGDAGAGNLLLSVFDVNGNLLGTATNGNGVTTFSVNRPGFDIASFRVSTPAGDTFGVRRVTIEAPISAAVPEPATLAVFGLMGAAGFGYVRRRLKGAPVAV